MITLKQVKLDIMNGRSSMIYCSSRTLWWTHLDEDLTDASETGWKKMIDRHNQMMKDPTIPDLQKQKMQALFKQIKNARFNPPVDPSGAPLFQMEETDKWISEAEKKPDHFGEHGLKAFMRAHHQNCNNLCFPEWKFYNNIITLELMVKNKNKN